jgi:UDP-2,3-diacylglucosamine pyrophosphatase LpxH
MLVAISDIHFVDGTAGEHNLPFSAFKSVFLSDIASLAMEKEAKEVKVLLLGDIIDLLRSTKWFDVPLKDRPWGSRGLSHISTLRQNSVTEKQCLRILGMVSDRGLGQTKPPGSLAKDTIAYKNWETLKLFRELEIYLVEHCRRKLPVEVIYVPGNHDRLCNLYPSVRNEVQRLFGLTVNSNTVQGDPEGEWWYGNEFECEAHGLYARHGHQYDIWNFGGGNDYTRHGHLQASIGDVITTEFAVKIPWMLDSMRQKYRGISKNLVNKTKDIDNVRPLRSVMEWIYYRIKKEDQGQVRRALDEVFDAVIKEILKIELVQQWRSPHTHYDELIRAASSPWLRWISKGILDLLAAEDLLPLFVGMAGDPEDPEGDVLTQAAYQENLWKAKRHIHYIVYGHTHRPLQLPLDVEGGREVIYINTGTWRNRVRKTVGLDRAPDFVDLKQMTYTIFYRKDEDLRGKKPDTLSFDMWTGAKKKYYA